jgi:flagellar protein FlgJ
MLEKIGSNPLLAGSHKNISRADLERACTEFESIFITYILKSMRTPIVEDGLFGKSNEARIVQSMFDENLALGVAKGGGMGLGKMLFRLLKE